MLVKEHAVCLVIVKYSVPIVDIKLRAHTATCYRGTHCWLEPVVDKSPLPWTLGN